VSNDTITRREYEQRHTELELKLVETQQLAIQSQKDNVETQRLVVALTAQVNEALTNQKVMLVQFSGLEKDVKASGRRQLVLLGFGLTTVNIVAQLVILALHL
jgi:isochorismate hydrolase